jgi:DnaJ-class molecular chaperone
MICPKCSGTGNKFFKRINALENEYREYAKEWGDVGFAPWLVHYHGISGSAWEYMKAVKCDLCDGTGQVSIRQYILYKLGGSDGQA